MSHPIFRVPLWTVKETKDLITKQNLVFCFPLRGDQVQRMLDPEVSLAWRTVPSLLGHRHGFCSALQWNLTTISSWKITQGLSGSNFLCIQYPNTPSAVSLFHIPLTNAKLQIVFHIVMSCISMQTKQKLYISVRTSAKNTSCCNTTNDRIATVE